MAQALRFLTICNHPESHTFGVIFMYMLMLMYGTLYRPPR